MKDFVFGALVTVAMLLASVSVVGYNQVNDFGPQLRSITTFVSQLSTTPPYGTSQQSFTTQTSYTVTLNQSQSTTVQIIYVTETVAATTVTYYSPYASAWFQASNVSIPVSWPAILPTRFEVGSIAGPAYGFGLTVPIPPCDCPPNATCTCTQNIQQVDFGVYPWWVIPTPSPVWANFTWNGWSSVPSPSSTTLFGGNVTMQWSVNSSLIYLNITVK